MRDKEPWWLPLVLCSPIVLALGLVVALGVVYAPTPEERCHRLQQAWLKECALHRPAWQCGEDYDVFFRPERCR